MPAAPSSRGCDACRRQKKKCDQIEPACKRCHRLRIECTGRGSVQFRFRNQFFDESAKPNRAAAAAAAQHQSFSRDVSPRTAARQPPLRPRPLLPLIKSPTNQTTYSLAGFVSILEITDPRFDVFSMSYWLGDLPKRFGTNRALDAAIQGVICAFPCLYTKTVTERAVGAYNEALKYVRLSLQDVRANVDTECMCALFLLHVIHDWIGKAQDADGIFDLGVSYILRSAKSARPLNEFERAVRRTLSVCIILESFHRRDIDLKSVISTLVITEGPRPYTRADGKAYNSLSIASLVNLPTLFQEPLRFMEHIKQDYRVLQIEVPLLRKQVLELRDYKMSLLSMGQVPAPALNRLISSVRAGYALALSIQINFGSHIQSYEPSMEFQVELEDLCAQALGLAALVDDCRPIGSGVARLPMVAAWLTTIDPVRRMMLMQTMEILQKDTPECPDWPSVSPNITCTPPPRMVPEAPAEVLLEWQ